MSPTSGHHRARRANFADILNNTECVFEKGVWKDVPELEVTATLSRRGRETWYFKAHCDHSTLKVPVHEVKEWLASGLLRVCV